MTQRFIAGATLLALLCLLSPVVFAHMQQQPPPATPTATASADYTGTAQGNLSLDNKPIPLKYAYAVQVDDVEGEGMPLSANDPKKTIVLVLSDRPLPKSLIENRNAPRADVMSMAQFFDPARKSEADMVSGLKFEIDAEKKTLHKFELLIPSSGASFDVGGISDAHQIKGLTIENGTISGTVLVMMPQPHPASIGKDDDKNYKGPKRYQYRVTFKAPLLSEPAVTQVLNGKDALDNEPINALKQYMDAAKKGDIAMVKKLTAATHQAYLNHPRIKEQLQQMKPELIAKQVKRVVVRGDLATIVIVSEDQGLAQVMIRMTREKDGWKLYFP